ncbi:MAG: DUF1349 domain-containing protein [Anaerolineae bacterium]
MDLFGGCHDQQLTNGLAWLREPPEWRFDEGGLTIVPKAGTDFFRPYGGDPKDDACLLYKEVAGDFTAMTRVEADLVGFGDAGALTVRASQTLWAKLCLERSPFGEVAAVSVVTRTWSDDANGELLPGAACYLRLTRDGNLFGMHYSLDGVRWRFVRAFGLELPHTVMLGVHAQAPFEGGCRAQFAFLEVTPEPVKDFRSGE